MGGTQSKNTSEVLTEIGTDIAMESAMKCTSSATQQQLLEFGKIAGDFTLSDASFKQGASIDMQCMMDNSTQADIASKLGNQVAQVASSKGQAALSALGNTKSQVSSNIKNKIMNNISNTTTQEMINSINQTQKIGAQEVGGSVVIQNLDMDQSANIIAKGLMESESYNSVIQEAATAIDQASSTEETTIMDSIFGSFSKTMIASAIIAAVVGIVIIVFIVYMVKK